VLLTGILKIFTAQRKEKKFMRKLIEEKKGVDSPPASALT